MTIIHTPDQTHSLANVIRQAVRQVAPNWFAATMGTGAVSLILGHFVDLPFLYQVGQTLWLVNIALFALFSGLYCAQWIAHVEQARTIADHPVMSLALGTIPMGLATIGNGFVLFGPGLLGPVAIEIAQGLWWFVCVLSLACGLGVPFLMFTRQSHSHEQMTGMWLLPVVAAEVAAVSGILLAAHLPLTDQAGVLLVSLVLWACSVPLALGLVVVLVVRMILHKLPPANVAPTCWLALGPIGTGALGMALFSQIAPAALATGDLAPLAPAIAGASLLLATLLWGYGLWWVGLAGLITARYFTAPVPFNLGWWGYVFPLGVFTLATLALGEIWTSGTLQVLGLGLVGVLCLIWLTVALRSLAGVWRACVLIAQQQQ